MKRERIWLSGHTWQLMRDARAGIQYVDHKLLINSWVKPLNPNRAIRLAKIIKHVFGRVA